MITITRGKQWPFPLPHADAVYPIISGPSIIFLFCMRGIRPKESNAFRKGKVEYGCVDIEKIPFIVWAFSGFDFDCYINIFREPQDKQDTFLAACPEANLVELYLVELNTGIVEGIRALGTRSQFVQGIKEICFNQAATYTTADGVDTRAAHILAQHSTKDLMGKMDLKSSYS